MSEQTNIGIIQKLYADFGQGNVAAILAAVDPQAEWVNPGPATVPYARKRRGLDEVRQFFDAVYGSVEVLSFEPREFIGQGDRVIVLGSWSGRARPTGKDFASDWAMAWTVRNGKVTSFRAYEDTHVLANAFGS